MSIQTAKAARQSIQSILGVVIDGDIGPKTRAAFDVLSNLPADAEWPPRASSTPDEALGEVDERSERNIATLHPKVRGAARSLVWSAAKAGILIRIISGTRTYAEQDALFLKRPKVTNARGGYSNHNFGIAFDIGVFNNTQYVPESPHYKTVGKIGKDLGFEWGGDWSSFKDEPHFQMRPPWAKGLSESAILTKLRNRKAAGMDAWA